MKVADTHGDDDYNDDDENDDDSDDFPFYQDEQKGKREGVKMRRTRALVRPILIPIFIIQCGISKDGIIGF